jgi:hypothetical protein
MNERPNDQVKLAPSDDSDELILTIENAIEDRVRTYRQMLRMKQVLDQAQRNPEKK